MKNSKLKTMEFLFSFGLFILNGCIEDNITPPLTGDLNATAEMLVYLESLGDFPNSYSAPELIDAEEVYSNINSYLVVDIRTLSDFSTGHIENSVNIGLDTLFGFIEKNASLYSKIVIVSKNGQSSAYFASLLRLASFNNVFTMSFGMASWNEIFASDWLNAIGNDSGVFNYTNDDIPKNDFASLPEVAFENPEAPINDRVIGRIKTIISQGFEESLHYKRRLTLFPDEYLVCYGNTGLLYYARGTGPLAKLGHHEQAVFYKGDPLYELRSSGFLQTLPNDKPILIYDGTGELSACIAAYLRILGYDAKTLLFGVNQLFYERMIEDPELMDFVFSYSRIKNYPYITGN